MATQARITLRATAWSGWVPGGSSIVTSTQVWTELGTALTPETLGHRKADYAETESLFYEVRIKRIVQDVVVFTYRNLVVDNPGGTINLTAPRSGEFILRWGETKKLSTPTMDAGTSVSVTVDEIR